jgi:hypothetical protein
VARRVAYSIAGRKVYAWALAQLAKIQRLARMKIGYRAGRRRRELILLSFLPSRAMIDGANSDY